MSLVREALRREPLLTSLAIVFLLALLPTAVAMLFDVRTINGINVWMKPAKFLFSLAVYYATVAWYFGYLPSSARRTVTGRVIIWGVLATGLLEMAWLVIAAVLGVPAHFNREAPWSFLYSFAGVGATFLLTAALIQVVMIARDRSVALHPTFRAGLIAGGSVAFIATLVTAFTLAAGSGHWVGGIATDTHGLPVFGWSRTGGDLRAPHFWALHAHQLLPFAAWLLHVRLALSGGIASVGAMSLGYAGFVGYVFVQALSGRPFLG